jgi:flagellar biosynthesis/type III secretory pathway M-ring protein FliF/YscJ
MSAIWKVITEKKVKEMKLESNRTGKIASGLRYYAVFAYGMRFGKTSSMRYIEMHSYVQGTVMLPRG